MRMASDRIQSSSWIPPMALGAGTCAVLWLVGFPTLGWLGFVFAALVWPTLRPRGGIEPLDEHAGNTATHHADPGDAAVPELVAGRYRICGAESRVTFTVRKLGLFTVRGSLANLQGQAEVDRAGGCRFEASVDAATLQTRNTHRDRHVVGKAFLHTERYPSISARGELTVRALALPSSQTAQVAICGVTQPVTITIHSAAVLADRDLRVVAETVVHRSRFGVTGYRWLVGDTIGVRIEAAVEPA